jgi:ankyrin repeat protein
MSAVQLHKLEHLNLLLHYNVRINATNKKGFTALHQAAEMGHFKIVQYLLSKGADHTILAQEHTALSLASMSKHRKVIKLLKRASL